MGEDPNTNEVEDTPMHERTIALADGRYMVFYTFGDENEPCKGEIGDQVEDV